MIRRGKMSAMPLYESGRQPDGNASSGNNSASEENGLACTLRVEAGRKEAEGNGHRTERARS